MILMKNDIFNVEYLISYLETLFCIKSIVKPNQLIFKRGNLEIENDMTELSNIIKEIQLFKNIDDICIYKDNYFEELVHFEGINYHNYPQKFGSYTDTNHVSYELSPPNFEFILISIFKLFDKNEVYSSLTSSLNKY